MFRIRQLAAGTLACFTLSCTVLADEAHYFVVPATEVAWTDAEGNRLSLQPHAARGWRHSAYRPYVVLDEPGEACLSWRHVLGQLKDEPPGTIANALGIDPQGPQTLILAVKAPGASVSGRLFVPQATSTQTPAIFHFTLQDGSQSRITADAFLVVKHSHYGELLSSGLPGGAWFRHQMRAAAEQLGSRSDLNNVSVRRRFFGNRTTSLEDSYALVSGGRAVSENLQLDRELPDTDQANEQGETVPLDSLEGITVREFDWKPLLAEITSEPELDPSAQLIPRDQHALFISSFAALTTLADQSADIGAPVLQFASPRSENARTRERYERQLGLSLDQAARLFGPALIDSITITGGDLYLRTGSDVALLLEAKNVGALQSLVEAQVALAASGYENVQISQGKAGQVAFRAYLTPGRDLCSYVAVVDSFVVVTNPTAQLQAIDHCLTHPDQALAALDEYRYFRHRYPRSDTSETALAVISDATIRRWCGPKWRIATSRRTRAAAVLGELQARYLGQFVSGNIQQDKVASPFDITDETTFLVHVDGLRSPRYGDTEFQTPINELQISHVTPEEARLYGRWRDGYQSNWSNFFDPIAVRFELADGDVAADLTVMPLIDNSRYRQMVELAGNARLTAASGDMHPETLLHWVQAIDPEGEAMRRRMSVVSIIAANAGVDPLSWVGRSMSVYVDDDPLWEDLKTWRETHPEQQLDAQFMEQHLHRLPIALQIESRSALKLTAFLAGLRIFIEQTAPGMTEWERKTHQEVPYVSIRATREAPDIVRNVALYYAVFPDSLTVTLSEPVLQRALERRQARSAAAGEADARENPDSDEPEGESGDESTDRTASGEQPSESSKTTHQTAASPAGASVFVAVDRRIAELMAFLYRDEYQRNMQELCFGNLPILNEWKRRFPDSDPVQLHEDYWAVRLVCPGGGQYRWNEEYQTMESTVYGHPAAPRLGPNLPPALDRIGSGSFSLTFEPNGLRARATLSRQSESQ